MKSPFSDHAEFRAICAEHARLFIEATTETLVDARGFENEPAHVLAPVVIHDFRQITKPEKEAIRSAYQSKYGVAYFIVLNPDAAPLSLHPLLDLAAQLRSELHLEHPLQHPLEGHPDAVARFGPPDGTVKIYDLPKPIGGVGYREQAETNEMFDPHHDGLGSGGTVETVVLYMESAPLFGGYTFFQNIPRVALNLARQDSEAFQSLFLPDALTIIRPRGKGAIKVQTPILFLNEDGKPESFFRAASGEYRVLWRDDPALSRARVYLNLFAKAFAYESSFIHFSGRGQGCFINNQFIAHARTAFSDDRERGVSRLLSRKWYMRTARDSVYKHVPGMFLLQQFADAFPQLCSPELLIGEWLYNEDSDTNSRIR